MGDKLANVNSERINGHNIFDFHDITTTLLVERQLVTAAVAHVCAVDVDERLLEVVADFADALPEFLRAAARDIPIGEVALRIVLPDEVPQDLTAPMR
jgi:hypothetical protein